MQFNRVHESTRDYHYSTHEHKSTSHKRNRDTYESRTDRVGQEVLPRHSPPSKKARELSDRSHRQTSIGSISVDRYIPEEGNKSWSRNVTTNHRNNHHGMSLASARVLPAQGSELNRLEEQVKVDGEEPFQEIRKGHPMLNLPDL